MSVGGQIASVLGKQKSHTRRETKKQACSALANPLSTKDIARAKGQAGIRTWNWLWVVGCSLLVKLHLPKTKNLQPITVPYRCGTVPDLNRAFPFVRAASGQFAYLSFGYVSAEYSRQAHSCQLPQ